MCQIAVNVIDPPTGTPQTQVLTVQIPTASVSVQSVSPGGVGFGPSVHVETIAQTAEDHEGQIRAAVEAEAVRRKAQSDAGHAAWLLMRQKVTAAGQMHLAAHDAEVRRLWELTLTLTLPVVLLSNLCDRSSTGFQTMLFSSFSRLIYNISSVLSRLYCITSVLQDGPTEGWTPGTDVRSTASKARTRCAT